MIPSIALSFFLGSFTPGCASVEQLMPITMSNANVVAVLNSIDQIEMDAGEQAKQKGASPSVKAFGDRLAQEHITSMQKRQDLAKRWEVDPQKPQLAVALEEEQEESRKQLGKTSGPDFDHAFIKYQIMMHEQVIKLLEETEDSMDQPEIRQHLRYMRPDMLSHLSAARAAERQLVAQR